MPRAGSGPWATWSPISRPVAWGLAGDLVVSSWFCRRTRRWVYALGIDGDAPVTASNDRGTGFPTWVAWSIPAAVIVLLVAQFASSGTEPDRLPDRDALASLVLQPDEGPEVAQHVGVLTEGFDPGYRVGGDAAFHSVFTDLSTVEYEAGFWKHDFTDGAVYVTSSALWFEDEEDVTGFLWERWHDFTLNSTDRQRGHDGSWLIFNPQYEALQAAQEAPIAVAAWSYGNVALLVLFVGAEDVTDALDLAQSVQSHVETFQDAEGPRALEFPRDQDRP